MFVDAATLSTNNGHPNFGLPFLCCLVCPHRILAEGVCDSNNILTQIPLYANDFDAYLVGCACELTFCQKELRALLTFCELVSPILRIYCDQPGRPIVFACAHETRLSCRFVLATLPSDAYSTIGSQRSQNMQPHLLTSKTPVQIRRETTAAHTFNISSTSYSALPDFHNDVAGDEVTLLATLPNTTHHCLSSSSTQNQADLTRTILVADSTPSSPTQEIPPVPSKPFRMSRVRQSITSPLLVSNTNTHQPPAKKARSVLFTHLEQSDDSESENMSIEQMDLELDQLTKRCHDNNATNLLANTTTTTPSRTILVADSDDEQD